MTIDSQPNIFLYRIDASGPGMAVSAYSFQDAYVDQTNLNYGYFRSKKLIWVG
jgi:hypothetical protein